MSEPKKFDPTSPFHSGYPHRCVKEKSVWHSDEGLKRCQWCSCEYEPFDLQRALAGEKVLVVGAGSRPRLILSSVWDHSEIVHAKRAKLVMLVHESGIAYYFDEQGVGRESDTRLVMAPKPKRKVVAWVNLYPGNSFWYSYDSQEQADKNEHKCRLGGRAFRIEYEEEI